MNVGSIEKYGWRQGRIFSRSSTQSLCRNIQPEITAAENSRLILLSHDCDIYHPGDCEPVVEVALAIETENVDDKQFDFGRHIRYLRLSAVAEKTNQETKILIESASRRFLPRQVLCDHQPGQILLGAEEVRQLRNWYAKRYTRAALPGTFNRRFKKPGAKIAKKLAGISDKVAALLMRINSFDELDGTKDYSVKLLGVMPHSQFGDIASVETVQRELEECAKLIDNEAGLKHRGEPGITSDRTITVFERDQHIHLDLDYLSQGVGASRPQLRRN